MSEFDLIERLKAKASNERLYGFDDTAALVEEAAAQLETANGLVTCMCGNPADHSGYEGHSPVSMYHHHLAQLEAQLAALSTLKNETVGFWFYDDFVANMADAKRLVKKLEDEADSWRKRLQQRPTEESRAFVSLDEAKTEAIRAIQSMFDKGGRIDERD